MRYVQQGFLIFLGLCVCVSLLIMMVLLTLIAFPSLAVARDGPQWAQLNDPQTSAWYARQRQPDNPNASCCGEADAYFADAIEIVNGEVFAIITDDRPDGPLRRPHLPVGTKVHVPAHKFKDTRSDPNPTGHSVVFVARSSGDSEYYDLATLCYLFEGGV